MAARYYRRKLRNYNCYEEFPIDILTNTNTKQKILLSVEDLISFKDAEHLLFSAINHIQLQFNFTEALKEADKLQKAIKTKADVVKLFYTIQEITFSIMDNIIAKDELGIVLERLKYLQSIVEGLPPNPFVFEGDIPNTITEILGLLLKVLNNNASSSKDFTTVISAINSLQNVIDKNLKNVEYVRVAEEVLLGILDNIIARDELGIVLERLGYLREVASKMTDSPGCYFKPMADMMLEIVNMITTGRDFDVIQNRLRVISKYISEQKYVIDTVKDFYRLLPDIMQNIIDRVELPIVLERLAYLSQTIEKIWHFLDAYPAPL